MKNTLLLFLWCLPAMAKTQTDLLPKLETCLQQFAAKGWSGSALAAKNGKVLLDKGYGLADRESKKPQTAQTVFSIGSITKQFTAAAILKLESQGKLKLDDPLSTFFPETPADKSGITLHQLLTHTAGFPDAIGEDYTLPDAKQFTQLAFATPLQFKPGQQYAYSNVGYSLLGIIVEKISGTGYEQFLRENLWLPSGMKQTGYLLPAFKKEQLATGYQENKRWGTALDKPWMADGPGWHLRANGGILSTSGDMFLWYKALRNNTVLPKTATDKMFAKQVPEGPLGMSFYGYGWSVQELDGKQIIWHNGGNGVYNANMTFSLADDLCVVVSSNSNDHISDDIALELLGILWNKTFRTVEEDAPYRNNPVTAAILKTILEKGAGYFSENSDAILRQAGFDFDNDMQLLGVGEQLEENKKWAEGVALFETYTRLFPRIVVAWNRLGKCRMALGDKAGAKTAWETSVKLRPAQNPAAEWLKSMAP